MRNITIDEIQNHNDWCSRYNSRAVDGRGDGSSKVDWVVCDCGLLFDKHWCAVPGKYSKMGIDATGVCAYCINKE